MKSVITAVLLLGMAAGCVSQHSGIDAKEADWKVGVTTRRDVVEKWGNPDRIRGMVWIWRDVRSLGSKYKLSYYHVGLTASSSQMATVERQLTFDEKGTLEAEETVESVPGGATWSANPWR